MFVICFVLLMRGSVEGGSGYFYPKPKLSFEIIPSIELFSHTITYEEPPVTQNLVKNHYKGTNYAQGYRASQAPSTNQYYINSSVKQRNQNTGRYYPRSLFQQPFQQSSQKINNLVNAPTTRIQGNQLIMNMGDYIVSIPISSDGIMADGEYLVKLPIYQIVAS